MCHIEGVIEIELGQAAKDRWRGCLGCGTATRLVVLADNQHKTKTCGTSSVESELNNSNCNVRCKSLLGLIFDYISKSLLCLTFVADTTDFCVDLAGYLVVI